MRYFPAVMIAVLFFSCSENETNNNAEKIPDTVYYEVPAMAERQDVVYHEFKKLDNAILEKLFACDTVYNNGFVGWYPSADDVYSSAAGTSLCSTNLEEVYYFKKSQTDYAFCLLVTYDEFAKGEYHASAPYVGGALFRKTDKGMWNLQHMKKLVITHGEMGYLKPYSFVSGGPMLPLLQLSFSYSATGEVTEEEHFFELFEMKEVFSMNTGGSYKGESEMDHEWSSEITFRNDPKNKFYDLLVVKTKGTRYDFETEKVVTVDTMRVFRYNDFRWVYEPVCE